MPNWVQNILTISGNADEINLIIGKKFSFANLIPLPSNVDKYWVINNWGCKWDASNISITKVTNKKYIINFTTPWGPPDKWLQFIHKKMPNVKFSLVYADEDFPTCGSIKLQKDEIIEKTYDINTNKQYALKFTKKYFPKIYKDGIVMLKKSEQIKSINRKLADEFSYLKKLIKNFQGVQIDYNYDIIIWQGTKTHKTNITTSDKLPKFLLNKIKLEVNNIIKKIKK